MTDTVEFSRLIDINKLGNVDFTVDTVATPEECAALAKRFDLLELAGLSVKAVVHPKKKGEYRVEGTFVTSLTQACVVTLEPVESQIEATFDRRYSEKADDWYGDEKEPDEEGKGISPEPPEPLIEGCFDLGEAVAEQLSLEMEPFPRKPDAEFVGGEDGDAEDDLGDSPFAVLRGLENKP